MLRAKMILAALAVACASSLVAVADWKADIGWNQLFAEKGASLETGAGVVVSMAEAPVQGNYMPNTTIGQLMNKTIIDGSAGSPGFSSHATNVARHFFGDIDSIAPGVNQITVYNANDWLNNKLGTATGGDPLSLPFKVQNHSWISNSTTGLAQICQRIDFVVNQNQTTMIGGVNNNPANPFPTLLSHAYNVVTVGRSDGFHTAGTTTTYGPGRVRPDIVAPGPNTSTATAMVSSVAAMLHEKAAGTNASRADVMRAVLLSGATKSSVPNWDRTTVRPMDDIYGAGQVNVYRSYKILEGGQYSGSLAQGPGVGLQGWDYRSQIDPGQPVYYEFFVPDGSQLSEFALTLNWNMIITDNNPSSAIFAPSEMLGDLSLDFFDSTGGWLGSIMDSSLATAGNIEHLYFPLLGPGHYTLRVTSDIARDYALAWYGQVIVPEPAAAGLITLALGLFVLNRRRNGR